MLIVQLQLSSKGGKKKKKKKKSNTEKKEQILGEDVGYELAATHPPGTHFSLCFTATLLVYYSTVFHRSIV